MLKNKEMFDDQILSKKFRGYFANLADIEFGDYGIHMLQ